MKEPMFEVGDRVRWPEYSDSDVHGVITARRPCQTPGLTGAYEYLVQADGEDAGYWMHERTLYAEG